MHCADAREVAASSRASNGADPKHRVRSAAAFAGQLKILRPLAALSAPRRLHLEFRELDDHIAHGVAHL
jgi:hypothetical protein